MLRDDIIDWLRKQASAMPSIGQIFIFGSFARGSLSFQDVDVVIVFELPEAVRQSAKIARDFASVFEKDLHVQKFYRQQGAIIPAFLNAAVFWEIIYEQGSSS